MPLEWISDVKRAEHRDRYESIARSPPAVPSSACAPPRMKVLIFREWMDGWLSEPVRGLQRALPERGPLWPHRRGGDRGWAAEERSRWSACILSLPLSLRGGMPAIASRLQPPGHWGRERHTVGERERSEWGNLLGWGKRGCQLRDGVEWV